MPELPPRTTPTRMPRPAPLASLSGIERQAILSGVLLTASILCLLLFAYVGFDTLSSARAYVGGEGLWSKAQKDAVNHLTRYAITRDTSEYQAFRRQLEVPLGDRQARLQLQRAHPDLDSVRAGFLRGGNHPDDIPGMIRFFRRFNRVSFVSEAIGHWTVGDSLIQRLSELGVTLDRQLQSPRVDPATVRSVLAELGTLSAAFTRAEDSFSGAMGAGARWTAQVLLVGLVLVAAGLVAAAVLSLRWASGRLQLVEAARRATEAKLRDLVEHAQSGIMRSTFDGRILSANPALVRLLGYERAEELLALDLSRDVYQEPAERERRLQQIREDGRFEVESTWRRRDGAPIQVRIHGRVAPGEDGGRGIIESFVEDVTKQRELESQLRQHQRMEAVGQLTGGIAHDFNNLLTVILSTASLIETTLPPEAEGARADLSELTAAARRGADIIRKLLALSRERGLQFRARELPPLVEASAAVLRRVLPRDIEVRVEHEAGTPPIRTDPAAVEQILLNLATNARDALPHGGVLTIRTRPAGAADLPDNATPGPRAVLEARDTGVGMAPEVRERVFEPFFTTKPPGKGSGLGLTMVYGLVEQHGAAITVESSPGAGSTFRIVFPPVAAPVDAPPARPHPAAERTAGRVLLVEDEAPLRRATERLLRARGFEVVAAADGLEALAVLEQDRRFDLVLSDVVMPRMTGSELLAEMDRRAIRIPVVLTSGYTARDGVGLETLPEGIPFLPKPWELHELLQVIETALANGPTPEDA